MSQEGRRALHAYLSPEAYAAWLEAADAIGVTLSGLLEALGQDLAVHAPSSKDGTKHPRWDEIVTNARNIDVSRRRRNIRRS